MATISPAPTGAIWVGWPASPIRNPRDPDAALQLVQWFQTQAQVTYLGGTPACWRTLSNDAAADPRWTAVCQAMDEIQPWTVGRYGSATLAQVAPGIFSAAGNGQAPARGVVRVALPDGSETTALVAVCADDGTYQAVPVDLGPPGSLATLDLYGTGIRGRSSLAGILCGAAERPPGRGPGQRVSTAESPGRWINKYPAGGGRQRSEFRPVGYRLIQHRARLPSE